MNLSARRNGMQVSKQMGRERKSEKESTYLIRYDMLRTILTTCDGQT